MAELLSTADGSHTVFNRELNETYHSRNGARQESLHVFINSGLNALPDTTTNIDLLEVGLGTGLNALLTFQVARQKKCTIHYHAIEPFPLDPELLQQLNYAEDAGEKELFAQIHQSSFNEWHQVGEGCFLKKRKTTLQDTDFEAHESFDLVYFDAFAPSKQPEMWARPMLAKVCENIKPDGLFVTYAATGQLRRDLVSLGMVVEKIPGAPGKREMIRAWRKK